MNAYEKRKHIRDENTRQHNLDKLRKVREDRSYEIEHILRLHEEVSEALVKYRAGWFVVCESGHEHRYRQEAFIKWVRELDAAKHEKRLDCPIDN